ncbi:MAG: Dabb family protein [Akkermansiaceae bacterium]|jgi:hypothetical protein|nr:Dabb family protein [Akkermansiaceae bacterium]MDP4721340.1 Dabb family protein [Akkermansiaceae bacterium]MDP4779439.1 Dabb family protein [Akkermansiaceae bacterium]MDP4846779.1 Dabb family protein [Akkermansiaceae bacterium]MDP4897116.1 Dabb family protein [Akkermansiaceae bacterium]
MKHHLQILFTLLTIALLLPLSSAHAEESEASQGKLRHVVCLKFSEDITEAQIQEIVDIIAELPNNIPEVKMVEGGKNVSIEDKDKGFTHCFTMTFDSMEDLKVYLPHEDHLALVEKVKPLLSDVFVVDYWVK